MNRREIVFVGHPACGDMIMQSGIGVYLAQYFDKVYFPGREMDRVSFESFFVNHCKIEWYWPPLKPGLDPFPFPEHGHILRSGIYHYQYPLPIRHDLSCIENCFYGATIPYSVRWDFCPLEEASKSVSQFPLPADEYVVVHDDPTRGYFIRRDPSWPNPIFIAQHHRYGEPSRNSILRWVDLLRNASEIHVIDSAMMHLAESITTFGKLFYHRYAKPLRDRWSDVDIPWRKDWQVIRT